MLPPAPIDARAPLSVWTGRELIVWGTAVRVDVRPRDGAAYNPATDSWRSIADATIELTDATAVWTGSEMIVFGPEGPEQASLFVGQSTNEKPTKRLLGSVSLALAPDPLRAP
jgi:hypothetical protein